MKHREIRWAIAHPGRTKWAAIMLCAAIPAFLSVSVAHAEQGRATKEQYKSVYLVKRWFGNEVRYGKNPAGKVMRISAARYASIGRYVCTPSGFGRKANCRVA